MKKKRKYKVQAGKDELIDQRQVNDNLLWGTGSVPSQSVIASDNGGNVTDVYGNTFYRTSAEEGTPAYHRTVPIGHHPKFNTGEAVDYVNYGLNELDAITGFISNNRLKNDEYIKLLNANSSFEDNLDQGGLGNIPAYTQAGGGYKGVSVVDYINGLGYNASFGNRKSYFADFFGNETYKGTAEQNIRLLNTLKKTPGYFSLDEDTVPAPTASNKKIVPVKKNLPLDQEAQKYWNAGLPNPNNKATAKATVGNQKYKASAKADFSKNINLNSGMIVNKRTGKAYVIKNNKAVDSFNVLTGVNVNKNKLTESVKEIDANPQLRATPTGFYALGAPVGAEGSAGSYEGNASPLNPFDSPGFDMPVINKRLQLAMHQTYDPKNRNKLYGTNTPYASWGCVNCNKSDYRKYVRNMPQNDTVLVVDSNVPEHLQLLKKVQAKKYGGRYVVERPYGGGPLTAEGAKEILRDGKVHGKKLTEKQKRYFGYIAGGGKPQHQAGGDINEMVAQCIRELQGGKQPQEILQELVEAGVPEQQGVQIIQAAASQVQTQTPQKMHGGCDNCAQAGGNIRYNARKVDAAPDDYSFAGEFDGRNYYNKSTTQALQVASSYKGTRGGQAYEDFLIQQLGSGVSPQELADKKYIAKAKIGEYDQFYKPSTDYVYTEPGMNVVDDPAQGFEGEVIYNPYNKHTIGKLRYMSRDTNSASNAGNLSSPDQDVQFMYVDEKGNIDQSRGMYEVPGHVWSNQISRGRKALYDEQALSKYKKQTGGVPVTRGLPDDLDYMANVNAEEGEIVETKNGNISKVAEGSGTHAQGGVDLAGVNRVLEDTADKRKDKASKALKMSPDEVEEMFGFRPKTSLTHSKAFEQASENVGKFKDKVNKGNKKLNSRANFDRYAYNAANQNYNILDSLPTEADIFNELFNHQEQIKSVMGIQDNGDMKKMGGGKYKAQVGTPGRNDPNKRTVVANTNVDAFGAPVPLEADPITGEPVMPDTSINGTVNLSPQVNNSFYEPTHWYDVAPSVFSLVDSMSREGELLDTVNLNQVKFKKYNPTAALNANQGDFNAALDTLNRPELGSGVERANVANLLGQKYRVNNEVLSQAENANTQIKNNEEVYNAGVRDKQSFANAQSRANYFAKVQLSKENQRLQKLKAIEDLTRVAQLKRRQNVSGNLIMKLSPHFNQQGEYDGLQYIPVIPPEYGMPEIPTAQTTQRTIPGYSKTTVTQKRGDKTYKTEVRQ